MQPNFADIKAFCAAKNVTLVAVSKTRPVSALMPLYAAGQRDFGENRVQEMEEKHGVMPEDIRWHLIGHLQRNKVKYIAPYVALIHSVDSLALLQEIDRQAAKNNRIIPCLLQAYVAQEETKFGLEEAELHSLLSAPEFGALRNIRIDGIMGMATNTDDRAQIRSEMQQLKRIFDTLQKQYFSNHPEFAILSMGMSSDYTIAIEEGSNMVRIGSLLFA